MARADLYDDVLVGLIEAKITPEPGDIGWRTIRGRHVYIGKGGKIKFGSMKFDSGKKDGAPTRAARRRAIVNPRGANEGIPAGAGDQVKKLPPKAIAGVAERRQRRPSGGVEQENYDMGVRTLGSTLTRIDSADSALTRALRDTKGLNFAFTREERNALARVLEEIGSKTKPDLVMSRQQVHDVRKELRAAGRKIPGYKGPAR